MVVRHRGNVDTDGPGRTAPGPGPGCARSFQFDLVQGQTDCKPTEQQAGVASTWHDLEVGSQHMEHGHARIVGSGLQGHPRFHLGGDAALRAVREPRAHQGKSSAGARSTISLAVRQASGSIA